MQTSDTSRLFHVGSGGTVFLGGPTVISAGSFPGGAPPQRFHWVEEFGIAQTKSGTTIVTYPAAYSGEPFIFLTPIKNSPLDEAVWVTAVGTGTFGVRSNATNDLNASSTTFFWRSIGTRVL